MNTAFVLLFLSMTNTPNMQLASFDSLSACEAERAVQSQAYTGTSDPKQVFVCQKQS